MSLFGKLNIFKSMRASKKINELIGTSYKSNDEIDWGELSLGGKLNIDIIRELKGIIDYRGWEELSRCYKFTEDEIIEFHDKVDWVYVSMFQSLSESFIEENRDHINWLQISNSQVLSWKFILKYREKLDSYYILTRQPLLELDEGVLNLFKSPSISSLDDIISLNPAYNLYQATKDQGWFIGYVNSGIFSSLGYFMYYPLSERDYFKKARIYWKDLDLTYRTKKYEPIREVKDV